jgi:hypothetical protein
VFLCAIVLAACAAACESLVGIHDVVVVADDAASPSPPGSPPPPSSPTSEGGGPPPPGDAGIVCNEVRDAAPCNGGGQNEFGLGPGEKCSSTSCACKTGLVCSQAIGTTLGFCVKPQACGASCVADADCLSIVCIDEKCR